MKVILKGGTIIDVDLNKSSLVVNKERVVIYNVGENAFPYHAKDAIEEDFIVSLKFVERIDL